VILVGIITIVNLPYSCPFRAGRNRNPRTGTFLELARNWDRDEIMSVSLLWEFSGTSLF
jgi:hypothetical protein